MHNDCNIEEIGEFLTIDNKGYILNTTSIEDIQEKWEKGVNEVIAAYKEHLGRNLHSVYLRGSVAKGKAIENISDIDTFAIVSLPKEKIERNWVKPFQKDFKNRFPFVNGVEIIISPLEGFEKRQGLRILIKTQSICMYGKNLAEKILNLKPGRETIQHLQSLENGITESLEFLSEEESNKKIKEECAWVMKRILRGGFELVMERSKKYTRDLYPCYVGFAEYYPEMGAEMYRVLEKAICPTDNINEIKSLLDTVGGLIVSEYKKLYY